MARPLAVVLLMATMLLSPTVSVRAADTGTATVPTLKDTLEKGLKARLPSEFAFVDTVVSKVDDGSLPLSLVQSTFLWARKRRTHPFEYFEQGLKLRAEKLGITL